MHGGAETMIRLQDFQTAAREGGSVNVSRQLNKQLYCILDGRSGKSKFEDISHGLCAAGMVQADS